MTMPKTASVMKSFGSTVLPEELHDQQILSAINALRFDLPGDPIGYIESVAPRSKLCECGAVHLSISDPDLKVPTSSSLHRLLATPYGDVVREYMRRRDGYETIRFGWQGIKRRVPSFVSAVQSTNSQTKKASSISSKSLESVIEGFGHDMPDVFRMIYRSLHEDGGVVSVSAGPGRSGRAAWQSLIDDLMFAWSTPVRKYLDEWLMREFGSFGGAVNCCIVMTDSSTSQLSWRRRWMSEQTAQQITPDC